MFLGNIAVTALVRGLAAETNWSELMTDGSARVGPTLALEMAQCLLARDALPALRPWPS